MIWNPDLIHYLCIAKSTTILAHHIKNTKDSNFESLASECLTKTPPNHSFFSHTVNNLTYTFLIDPTFVIFAIFDHHLLKSHALAFLNRVRSSLIETLNQNDNFVPFSLQTQFDSVFNETLNFYDLSPSGNEKSSPLTTLPLIGKPGEGLKKKKRLIDDGKDAALVDLSDDAVSLPFAKVNDRQKAKHVWKKHVWVVLLLDLFVCAVLFVIWLWVCSGFKCMAY